MYKEILRNIAGIEVFPVLSLVLFFAIFSFMLLRVLRMDHRRLERLAAMPLESGDSELPPGGPRGTQAR